VAALTTGTVAMSGVALAATNDQNTGTTGATGTSATDAAAGGGQAVLEATPAAGFAASTVLTSRRSMTPSPVSLTIVTADVSVRADAPAAITFRLLDARGRALDGQKLLVQALFPSGWTTFKELRTDASGTTGYTARVLTTTQFRVSFEGTGAHAAAVSDPGIIRVLPPRPIVEQAPRTLSRTALTPATTTPPARPGAGSLGEKAAYLASLQAGKPYVYGAEGPYAFDCSGLVQYVYKQLGKTLPRTTDEQFAATTRVARGQEQPGDLIFFGSPGSIYHMGIYAGNGKMWVAPKSGDVVKLETIWTSSYLVGRVA